MGEPNTFRLQLREDRPATIEEHEKLRDEIKRLRELNAVMLEALQIAVARADKNLEGYDGRDDDCRRDYERCKAAIAKATGGKT